MSSTEPGFGQENPANFRLILAGDDEKLTEHPIPEIVTETYQAFYNRFGEAVASGKEEDIPVTATAARDVLRVIEAILESAKTGRDVTL